MISPVIKLSLAGTNVRAERGDAPNGFWYRLLSEWGAAGSTPAQEVEVSVERLIARRQWLVPACRQYGVGIDWSPDLRALVESNIAERAVLTSVLRDQPTLTDAEVLERLSGTRFTRPLRSFQIEGLGKLLALDNGANFSVPGAGKTTVALATYEAERADNRVEQMLVVAPLSAFDAWTTGIEECYAGERPTIAAVGTTLPDVDAEILLVNYHRLDGKFDELAEWVGSKRTLLLLDEAHRMKRGWDGAFGAACLNMAFRAARRDILTGTPAPQSPQDLIALLDFLWPGQANRVIPQPALATPTPPDAGVQIANAIRPLFTRTRKSDLELDDPIPRVIPVDPSPLQAQIYDALCNQYQGLLTVPMSDRARLARMGQVTMYLLEAATNPKLLTAGSGKDDDDAFRHPPIDVPPGSALWDMLKRYNQHETPTKFQQLAAIVAENAEGGRKTLVWTNFVRNIHALKRMLARYEPAAIYGAIPSEVSDPQAVLTREAELARFRDKSGKCMVLLANPAAMSEGVSLHHDTNDAVYLDRTFNAGQYLQSLDRIHRLGLKAGVETRVTYLITKGTIDEVVDDRVATKAKLLGEMLEDPDIATMALPSDEDFGDPIDIPDLEALFKHLRGHS